MTSRVIGNFTITEKLGEGGMGEVYKGFDTMLEREVAIKSLRPELSSRPDIVQRFRTEAVALGRLNHPNIATVYTFVRDADQFFMIMEFVRGETLDQVIIRRRALPWQEAIDLACQALQGLEHAHRLGVVHRDIKPANIMLSYTGQVKLMDFGIARILEKARLTRTGHLIGTLEYMSPEQVQGRDTDARSDIYSLGVVLYELLAGHVPFEKGSDYDLIKSQVEELPVPPRAYMPQIPLPVEEMVLRALAKKPEERHASASAFHAALQGTIRPAIGSGTMGSGFHKAPETRYIGDPSSAAGVRGTLRSTSGNEPSQAFAGDLTLEAEARNEQSISPGESGKACEGKAQPRLFSVWRQYPGLVFSVVSIVVAGYFVIPGERGKSVAPDTNATQAQAVKAPLGTTREPKAVTPVITKEASKFGPQSGSTKPEMVAPIPAIKPLPPPTLAALPPRPALSEPPFKTRKIVIKGKSRKQQLSATSASRTRNLPRGTKKTAKTTSNDSGYWDNVVNEVDRFSNQKP